MNIIFVGGGASTLVAANLLKKKNPSIHITIIDKKAKLGRKLAMTGNGKCNLAPLKDDINKYNNPSFASSLFKEIPLEEYLNILSELGIPTRLIKEHGYYPLCENAANVVDILLSNLKDVTIINDEVIDYDKTTLKLASGRELSGNKIVFATGGKSYPDSGSDGNLFSVFAKHEYQINPLKPSLCPIKVKENIKSLFGARNHASIALINQKGQVVYQENGEIMFKKDALSGIAIMNMSSYISHHPDEYKIELDFLMDNKFVIGELNNYQTLLGYVNKPIAEYILRINHLNPLDKAINNKEILEKQLRGLTFHYDDLYDFDYAQITCGGIDIKEIDQSFMSKKENNIYFMGEMLDIDGRCGGYNLRYALTSAIKLVKGL